jgi:hypothetical protein
MKKTALASALLVGLGAIAGSGVAQEAPADKAPASIRHVKVPSMRLHKELEDNRVKVAAEVASYTVSVEIDYKRDEGDSPFRLPGEDDPFRRYDFGPFSGLVVGPNHILISDLCLGDFAEGPGLTVDAITVTLPNGERWPARVVGRHQIIDLALLELDCEIDKTCPVLKVFVLPSARVPVQRGDMVIVVGRGQNPLGTLVNDGIVSALDRKNGKAFQLDARIGNSTLGAPVVNRDGGLVGMVTLHRHEDFGQASGVSYAAYLDEVYIAYLIMREGKFIEKPPKPFMGVASQKKWPDKPGLAIGAVTDGSGAQKAGLRVGDVILKVNDVDMNDIADLMGIILKHKVGDTITVRILRGDTETDVKVTLGTRL